MCVTPNRPLRNTPLLPTGHWRMAAFDSNMGNVKYIKHWKPSRGTLMRYFGIVSWCIMCDTPNRPVRNAPLFLTGHWGMAVFDSNMRHVKHSKRWKPSRGPRWAIFDWKILSRCLSYRGDSQWETPHYSQPTTEERQLYGAIGHIKLWKLRLGPRCVI